MNLNLCLLLFKLPREAEDHSSISTLSAVFNAINFWSEQERAKVKTAFFQVGYICQKFEVTTQIRVTICN